MKTIITGAFQQETNRYAEGVTTMEIFQQTSACFGTEAVRKGYQGTRTVIGAYFSFFDQHEEYQLIAPMALVASPGPEVAQDVWQTVMDSLLEAIAQQDKVDGVLLDLHGAMVSEAYEDAEGELLRRVRLAVGKDVPIVASLDLHVNLTQKMVDNADALFVYDYYPHVDSYETGYRAAECMFKTLEGSLKPVMAWKQLDMILMYMPTEEKSFAPFLAEAQQLRGSGKLVNVNICHGFFAADVYDQGMAVVAVADGDMDLAQQTADALAEKMFAARRELTRSFYTSEEAVKLAMESEEYPVVLADVNDNPGSGSSCDATELLRTLIDMGAQDVAVAVMYDPETVEQACKAGVGATAKFSLGGKIVPEVTGGPIECEAYVKAITDGRFMQHCQMSGGKIAQFGKCALLQIDSIQVIVCSYRTQPYDLGIFPHMGILPEHMKILMVKSAAHFRADYGKIAKRILDVETPAQAPQRPEQLPLSRSRRPIYPLDDI